LIPERHFSLTGAGGLIERFDIMLTTSTGGYQWDFTVILNNANALVKGLGVTLAITLYAIVVGSVLGSLVAHAKGSQIRLVQALANGFTDIFRAIPVLVTMIWLFYSFPSITVSLGLPSPIRLDPQFASVIALSIYLAAQLADILRAGIDSIPAGQYDVARTLGMSSAQVIRYIQIPQVLKLTFPAVLGQYVSTLLLGSLASVIAVGELLHQAQNIITNQYHALEVYTTVALIYLAVAWPVTFLAKTLSRQSFRATRREGELGPLQIVLPKRTPSLGLDVESLELISERGQSILNDINFRISPGTVLGIFGPSGAGKSSLLRLLAGLSAPSSGCCVWQDSGGKTPPPRCGYVPQGLYLWPHLSAAENIALALHVVDQKTRDQARQIALQWLAQLGLADRIDAKPGTLSGGEAQRVAIARALAINPEVFLLDEITSALDPELIAQVIEILSAIVRSGATVIIVSHHFSAVYSLIDNALFIGDGRQLDFGPKADVFSGRIPKILQFLARHALWEPLPVPTGSVHVPGP
jgi:polar amino acid transport system permease protein